MSKTRVFKIYFYVVGVLMFIWWPIGHWVYPDIYHKLLGFQSYDLPMVQVVGTLSLFAVLGVFFVARDPQKNRDFFVTLLIMSVLMVATYFYLIQINAFPVEEYFNIGVLLLNAIIASLLFPWKSSKNKNPSGSNGFCG